MMKSICIISILILFSLFSQASGSGNWGYVSDVKEERASYFYEVVLSPPLIQGSENLADSIWAPVVAKEVREKYRDRFGQIDTAAIDVQGGQFRALQENSANLQALETDNQKRREFAEFTVKRLSEFHFDNYMKTEPKMRAIYETKEKLSNIQVKVSEQANLQAKYSFAGNVMDLILHNPYLDCRLAVEMDPHSFGPSSPVENRLWLGKDITKSSKIISQTSQKDGITSLELVRSVQRWTNSIGVSAPLHGDGTSPRENRLSLGLGRAF